MLELDIHTDDPQIRELCERYWQLNEEGEFVGTVRSIAQDYGESQRQLREVIRSNSTAYSPELVCDQCGSYYEFTSRSDYKSSSMQHIRGVGDLCSDCYSTVVQERRRKREKELRKQREKRKSIVLSQFWYVPEHYIEPTSLTFQDVVHLLSLVRVGANEDYAEITPLYECRERLAPTEEYTDNVLSSLHRKGYIDIHPGTDLDALAFENERVSRYNPRQVTWRLTVGRSPKEVSYFVDELERIFENMDWPSFWEDAWPSLCRDVAMSECLEYLDHQMNQRGFQFNPGPKTKQVLDRLLDQYSVAQAYNFIWSASKNAADYLVRENVPKRRAANSVVGSIQRRMEAARDRDWTINAYRRDFECPRTMVSKVLFSTALHMGDEGFTQVIGGVTNPDE